jgi:predicted RecB family nuclease
VATRYDVSAVPLQGGYVAKQCPVRAQWEAVRPREPLPPSAAAQRRIARGREFEVIVTARLAALNSGACLIEAAGRAEREAATLAAARAAAPVIIGGRLPADEAGRRVGEPDVLVAAADGSGYRPVDIKHHRCLEVAGGGLPAICSALARPGWEAASTRPGAAARKRRDDLLQLAHYQRMLAAAGMAADGAAIGGIIGVDGVVAWYDLDAPIWTTPGQGGSRGRKRRSTMAVYDFEFAFRLDILAVAGQHVAGGQDGLLVVPVRIGECGQCPWWSWCGPQLEAGTGDVSLLPRVGWRAWRVHRDHGVRSRSELASLDHRTATLVAGRVDLRPLLAAADAGPPERPVGDVIGARKQAQLAVLRAAGIGTLGDTQALCRRTAAYCDEPLADLPEQIDQARAALGGQPAYLRRGISRVVVPRADIEVDIDMESAESGVYLWGVLVTRRAAGERRPPRYRPFCAWEPLTEQAEADLFSRFWAGMARLRREAAAAGRSFAAYCYNASAETSALRRISARTGSAGEVAAFTESGQWFDLREVFDRQLITGQAAGLKSVAKLAGFAWQVPDPGGEESMVRYGEAVGAAGHGARQAARRWLLRYNRDDVLACVALREWLDGAARNWPPVAALGN